ncbi:MAG: ABC transporter permease [Oscillospiraceae bacterium]|jgi:ABC-2 type transport system permease protein
MKNIFFILIASFKKNFGYVFLAVGCAVILILLHNTILTTSNNYSKIRVGIIDNDNSPLSENLKNYLCDELDMIITENLTYDEFSLVLIDKKISAIIEIDEGFEASAQNASLKPLIITILGHYENAAFLNVYLESYMNSIGILSSASNGDIALFDTLFSDYKLNGNEIEALDASSIDREKEFNKDVSIAAIGFFLMMIFGIGLAISYMITDDKILGVYTRIQASPIKPYQYLVGSTLFGILLCFITIFLYIGCLAAEKIDAGIGYGTLSFMLVLYSLLMIAFSLMAALVFKTKNSIMALSIGFSTIGCIMGGAWFPLDYSPKALQTLAKITPQYWFMDAVRMLSADENANISINIVALLLFTLLFSLVGLYAFSNRNASK